MTAFDFTSTWVVSDGYPKLAWETELKDGNDTAEEEDPADDENGETLPGFGFLVVLAAVGGAALLRETRK